MRMRKDVFVVCLAIGLGLSTIGGTRLDRPAQEPSWSSLPKPFRITPEQNGQFRAEPVQYNPKLDRYVVFYEEYLSTSSWDVAFFSRIYDPTGKPTSGAQKIISSDPGMVGAGLVYFAYNALEDTFFFVSLTRNRSIYGLALDGSGRPLGGGATPIQINENSQANAVVGPNVAWIPSVNRFAVSWTSSDVKDPANSRNGYYLAIFDSHFKKVFGPKKVRGQFVNNGYFLSATVLPLEDKLLWGSADDAPNSAMRPVLWFTDFKGEVQKSYGQKGLIYPGGAIPYGGWVQTALDPDQGVVLVYWRYSNHHDVSKMKYWEYSTRILGTDGVFKTSAFKMPRQQPFQYAMIAACAAAEKRFFLVCEEYITFRTSYGGKFWGFYMDEKGRLENKKGQHGAAPIPLIETNLNPRGFIFLGGGLAPSADNKSFFLTYNLRDYRQHFPFQAWGLIYK